MTPNPHRAQIETLLEASPHPMSTPAIAKALNLTSDQVRNVLRGIRASGRLLNDVSQEGTVYSLSVKLAKRPALEKKSDMGIGPLSPAVGKAAKPAAQVIYPPGLKVTKLPSPPYRDYEPAEWHHARPEGRQHEALPSRRGDVFNAIKEAA